MALETERLLIRELTLDDAPFIVELLNEPSFLEFIGDRGVRNVDDAKRYITEGPMASWSAHGHGLSAVVVKETGELIGMCGLLKRDALPHRDLGYAYVPRAWGKGYALEAARGVMSTVQPPATILAIVSPGNAASIRLLEKMGFVHQPDGPGTDENTIVYAIEVT